MAKIDEDRLQVVHRSGGGLKDFNREILEDTKTGVQYLLVSGGYGLCITPILDRDGKPYCGK